MQGEAILQPRRKARRRQGASLRPERMDQRREPRAAFPWARVFGRLVLFLCMAGVAVLSGLGAQKLYERVDG
jgi:hypothetical protein